jgi:hypothetical protein
LNGTYGYLSGTSMAAPHVAGAWAVLKSAKLSASVTEALNALVDSGLSITDARNGIAKQRMRLDLAVYRLEGLLPINGVCGAADGQTFNTAPNANLCAAGSASTVSGAGPWGWNCDGLYGGNTASCSANITTFTISISVTNGAGGDISASASTVHYGGSVTFTMTANSGYTLSNLTDNGTTANATANPDGTYTYSLNNVTANHTVVATFAPIPAAAVPALPHFGAAAASLLAIILFYNGISVRRTIR